MSLPVIVFLTAIKPEFEAVLKHVVTDSPPRTETVEGREYTIGEVTTSITRWQVVVRQQDEQGNCQSALEADWAIRHFKPSYLFFVGVAGGLKDVSLGDVVAVTYAKGFESVKISHSGEVLNRFHQERSSESLVKKAKAVNTVLRSDKYKTLVGPVASGEKVISSPEFKEKLQKDCNDTLAVEMEAIGFLKALRQTSEYFHVKGIVIRGISDLIVGKTLEQDQEWQPKAAENAATFAFALLEQLKPTSPPVTQPGRTQDWDVAPEVSVFFGRAEELKTLGTWIIEDHCKLIAILGLGGIGKTKLLLRLAKGTKDKPGIQEKFEYVIWRSLSNAQPITEILADIIKLLSNQQEINLPNTIGNQISRLVEYLRLYRCLLILDNFDTILKSGDSAGQYREGYEEYGRLLKVIGETQHQSCLLLTSREEPQEIARLKGRNRPVRLLLLGGLDEESGRKTFLEHSDSSVSSASGEEWKKLVELYNGNPLFLELVAKRVNDVFDGDISSFLRVILEKDIPLVFELLEKELLKWHFERLSAQEKEVMYWLAVEREPILPPELKKDILSPVAREQLEDTLQSLQRRIPLEKSASKYTLQPVLIEYTTKQFIKQIGEEVQITNPVLLGYIQERLVKQISEEIKSGKIELFNNYALLKASAKDYVREAQVRLIINPLKEKLIHFFGTQDHLEQQLKQLLSALQNKARLHPGYLGGNTLNLLCQMNVDLKDYDFSNLEIRQAYLQGVNLQEVNFAYSRFVDTLFTQHFSSILTVAFSTDRKLLATGDANAEVRVWRVDNGEQLHTFKGHTNWLRSVMFNPTNNQILVSASEDQTIRIWDVESEECLNILRGHTNRIRSIAFSPDGQTLISGGDDCMVKIWNMNEGKCINTLPGHQQFVLAVAFSPDGKTIASGGDDLIVKLWNSQSGECLETLSGHRDSILSLAFSHDGQLLASASEDQKIILWDIQKRKEMRTLVGHTNWVWSVAFNSDISNGQILASSSADRTIRLWKVESGQCIDTLTGHTNWIRSIKFSTDGKLLASGSDDQTLKIWDVTDRKCLKTLRGYTSWIWKVVFSPDGESLASDNGDKVVRIWRVSDGTCLKTLRGHKGLVQSIAYSLDGKTMITGSDDQTMKVWEVESGKCFKTIKADANSVRSLAFHPSGKMVASCGTDHYVRLWNIDTGKFVKALDGHNPCNWVWSVTFSPVHPNRLISSGDDQTAILWELNNDFQDGKLLKVFKGHTNSVRTVTFGHRGKLVATGSEDTTVRIWDTDTGECLTILKGHDNWVWSVAFSYDDRLLASGSNDQMVKIWDVSKGECIQTLKGHTHKVRSVAFSPKGRILASGSEDGTIRLWDIETGKFRVITAPRPYERMNITGVTGLNDAQKEALMMLGAIENGGETSH